MELVGRRVERSQNDRDDGTVESADEECSEHRVLGQVRELAEHEIPGAEPRAEARDRREREDHAPPRARWAPTPGERSPTPSDDRLNRSQGSAVREPGASPGRSRRCKGSCSPAEAPLATGRPAAGKAVGEGAPSQKTCRLLHTEPLVEGGFVARRSIVLVAVLGLALALAATTLGATVTVRVEGKTQPIFGSVPVKVDAPNALAALDVASTLGEFYYGLTTSSFGDLREPGRQVPRRRQRGLGVQGQRHLTAGRRRPGRAQGRRRGALVLRDVRRAPAARRRSSLKAATANCYTVTVVRRCGQVRARGRGAAPRRRTAGQGGCQRARVRRQARRPRAGLRRRRRAVERREVRRASLIAPLLAALALAGCGGAGPTRRRRHRAALGHARPRQRGARRREGAGRTDAPPRACGRRRR